jgi:replicative DNA helicase
MIDRPLPHNQEIEKMLLACLMEEQDLLIKRKYAYKLKSDDFYNPRHGTIFEAIIELITREIPTELVSLSKKLSSSLEDIGGEAYLLELLNSIATTAYIEIYVEQIKELSAKRKAIATVYELGEDLHDEDTDITRIQDASMELAKIHHNYQPRKDFTTSETLSETNDILKDCQKGESRIFIPFCIPAIDSKVKLLRKQMMVTAANSGIGKTALGLSCLNRQIENKIKCCFLCGESSRHEIIIRLISIQTNKPFMWYMNGMPEATQGDINNYAQAMQRLIDLAPYLYIFGKGDYEHSALGMRDVLTSIQGRDGALDKAYFDYLQNMKAPPGMGRASKEEQVSENVMQVNNIITDFDIAGTVFCQLNREAAKQKRPYMENLKYASTIENEAHVVTFLHRQKEANPVNGILETEFYSDKTRLQEDVYCKLAFHCKRAEYTGLLSATYGG